MPTPRQKYLWLVVFGALVFVLMILAGLRGCSNGASQQDAEEEINRALEELPAAVDPWNCMTRAVWIEPDAFPIGELQGEDTNIKRMLDNLQEMNFNTVFLESPSITGSNGEVYNGRATEEQFRLMLGKLKSRRIVTHVWIRNRWRISDNTDNPVDLNAEQEREKQVMWVKELLTKFPNLDGVHLDWIRTEYLESINAPTRDNITDTVRRISREVRTNFPVKFITASVKAMLPNDFTDPQDIPGWFIEFLNDPVLNGIGPSGNPLFPVRGYGAQTMPVHFRFSQDPVTWLAEDLIDAVAVMYYPTESFENDHLEDEITRWKNCLSFRINAGDTQEEDILKKIIIGLPWYVGGSQQRDIDYLAQSIEAVKGTYDDVGISLYELESSRWQDDQNVLVPLLREKFGNRKASCLGLWPDEPQE